MYKEPLKHPELYGLTEGEVQILLDDGIWDRFYRNWRRSDDKIKYPHCKSCKSPTEDIKVVSLNGDLICSDCVIRIRKLAQRD